jgi:hypothetical protein
MSEWHSVAETKPPEGKHVEVITQGGDHRTLFYKHGLWWLPGSEMYVYFVPKFWRLR